MIVTRRRRKSFPWKRLGFPLVALLLIVFAFSWSPSRNAIANGPAAPLWRAADSGVTGVTAPLHFEAQNRLLAERAKEITQLQAQVSDFQAKSAIEDKKVADLQSHIATLDAQAATARGAAPAKTSIVSSGETTFANDSGAPQDGDLSTGATPDMHRTAQFWANMEPDNAAKVISKLPVVYVARVFALMPADAAGSIMDALPATYVALLTQEQPQLKR